MRQTFSALNAFTGCGRVEGMGKKALPELYLDDHIKPGVLEGFEEEGFKCLLIAKK